MVATSNAYAEWLVEDLVADANAGRGPRELAARAEKARRRLRRRVVSMLDDPVALDRLEDARVIEISAIEQARGSAAAAAVVNTGPAGAEGDDVSTPLADVVAALEAEGITATMVSRWLDTPHDDLDDRHADPAPTPAEAGTVPGPWTTCEACMRPARWSRTGGLGAVDLVCDFHRQELGDRDAAPWQPEQGYDCRQGGQP